MELKKDVISTPETPEWADDLYARILKGFDDLAYKVPGSNEKKFVPGCFQFYYDMPQDHMPHPFNDYLRMDIIAVEFASIILTLLEQENIQILYVPGEDIRIIYEKRVIKRPSEEFNWLVSTCVNAMGVPDHYAFYFEYVEKYLRQYELTQYVNEYYLG